MQRAYIVLFLLTCKLATMKLAIADEMSRGPAIDPEAMTDQLEEELRYLEQESKELQQTTKIEEPNLPQTESDQISLTQSGVLKSPGAEADQKMLREIELDEEGKIKTDQGQYRVPRKRSR